MCLMCSWAELLFWAEQVEAVSRSSGHLVRNGTAVQNGRHVAGTKVNVRAREREREVYTL